MEDAQILELGEAFLKKFAHYVYPIHIYNVYNVERGIIQFANKNNADAVALIAHGKTDLQQLFSSTVTKKLSPILKSQY